MAIDDVERKGLIPFLAFLYNWKGDKSPNQTEVLENIKIHNETLKALADWLESINWIKQEKLATAPQRHIYYLTEEGRVAARHAAALLNKIPPPFPQPKKDS